MSKMPHAKVASNGNESNETINESGTSSGNGSSINVKVKEDIRDSDNYLNSPKLDGQVNHSFASPGDQNIKYKKTENEEISALTSRQLNSRTKEFTYEGHGEGSVISFNQNQYVKIFQSEEIQDKIKLIFKKSNPDESNFVLTETLLYNLVEQGLQGWVIESVKRRLARIELIDYETFHKTIADWVEDMASHENSPKLQKAAYSPTTDDVANTEGSLCRALDYVDRFSVEKNNAGNRRSTLQPNKIGLEFSPSFSPIRPINEDDDIEFLCNSYKCSQNESFDYTIGTLETDANTTLQDPLELKQELMELSFTNAKLKNEKMELTMQAEKLQSSLKKKCKSLEEALDLSEKQSAKIENIENENKRLKCQIEEECTQKSKLQEALTHCYQKQEDLKKYLELLEGEISDASKQIEIMEEEKQYLDQKLKETLKEVMNLKAKLVDAHDKLSSKEMKIQNFQNLETSYKRHVQKLQEENNFLLVELNQLKERKSVDHYTFPLQDFEEDELTYDSIVSENNPSSEQSSSSQKITNSETGRETLPSSEDPVPINIKDEIILTDGSQSSSLPFCEKNSPVTETNGSKSLAKTIKDALSMYYFRHVTGSEVDDDLKVLVQVYSDEIRRAIDKWSKFIELHVECEIQLVNEDESNHPPPPPPPPSPPKEDDDVMQLNSTEGVTDTATPNLLEWTLEPTGCKRVSTCLPDFYLKSYGENWRSVIDDSSDANFSSTTDSVLNPDCVRTEHETCQFTGKEEAPHDRGVRPTKKSSSPDRNRKKKLSSHIFSFLLILLLVIYAGVLCAVAIMSAIISNFHCVSDSLMSWHPFLAVVYSGSPPV